SALVREELVPRVRGTPRGPACGPRAARPRASPSLWGSPRLGRGAGRLRRLEVPRARAARRGQRRRDASGREYSAAPASAALEASEKLNVYLLNSVNPFRLEGQKTIVFEALEQLGWEAPEWIALPAGNLGNTSAFGNALRDARDLGLISRVPRLAAVQAEGANPLARAFREGFARRHRVSAETAATAIRIGDPAS